MTTTEDYYVWVYLLELLNLDSFFKPDYSSSNRLTERMIETRV